MATNFLEMATTLTNLGAKWLPEKKVNFTPWLVKCQNLKSGLEIKKII